MRQMHIVRGVSTDTVMPAFTLEAQSILGSAVLSASDASSARHGC
jgi:hypothetical protein